MASISMSALVLCTAAVVGLTAGCDDGVYVMNEIYEIKGEERIYSGGGCMLAIERDGLFGGSSGSSVGTADPDSDFGLAERSGEKFQVIVSTGHVELVRRDYSEKLLLSGKRDEFAITTQAGRHYELAYWGGDECDTSHLPRD